MRLLIVAVLSVWPLLAWADQSTSSPVQFTMGPDEPVASEKTGKVLRAERITGAAPVIDGRFDDEIWSRAAQIDDFVQNEPDNMATAVERTIVQVAYDDRYLYAAVRCWMRNPAEIATGLGRRDAFPPSDRILLSLDPRHDHLTAYIFEANPSGVQGDFMFFDDVRSNTDYDAVWDVSTQLTPEGWTAEFRIPFSQMRFEVDEGDEAVWGFNVRRNYRRTAGFDRWIATPRGVQGFVSRFGHLVFTEGLSPPRRVELLPFALARRDDPVAGSTDHGASGGLDVRVGLGTSATLSATVNPDFAQVEQDPAVLNLSIFETFFPEKRPFFLEDATTFVPPSNEFQLFYSRRIGRSPGRFPIGGDVIVLDRPDQTTILVASKVTGKSGGWTYGAVTALTGRESALVATDGPALGRDQRTIEPRTSYNVVRLQRDVLGGTSNVGATLTGVVREQDSNAFTGGLDYTIRWSANRFNWNGNWAITPSGLRAAGRRGAGGVTTLGFSGKYVSANGHYERYNRDFWVNDLGFFRTRPDKSEINGRFTLSQPDPWRILRSSSAYVFSAREWNGDGVVFVNNVETGGNLQFANYWSGSVTAGWNLETLDDLDTRGGPPIVRPAEFYWNGSISSDSRNRWQASIDLSGARADEGGWNNKIGPRISLQPSPRLQASLSASYTRGLNVAQWVTNTDVTGDGATDFVYGRLRQDVVDLTARGTFAFSRDLTLQAYMQPFVAVGDYADIRRLARPRSFDFESATLSFNPNFNRKSLRSNVVVRWEYLRGSTLFVVWNMSSLDTSRPGTFEATRDLRTALSAPGTHSFLVKLAYRFAM